MKYLGYPYTATGNSPSTGFSCIGFVSYVYHVNGIPLPGDLQDALNYAPQVPLSALEPGDVLYFQNTVWNGLSHAAIYIGGGKFIHAEWYNTGVVISSFSGQGGYYTAHYLTANRPWAGAAVGAVISQPVRPPKAGGPQQGTQPGVSASTQLPGTAAVVTASSLYVRTSPSKTSAAQTVLAQGTTVTIIGRKGKWYKVQLADGTVGWVMGSYVSTGSSAPSATATPGANAATGAGATVGNPTAPAYQGYPSATARRPVSHATARVSGLNVRSGPSTTSSVVGTAYKGERLVVLGHAHGWTKVRLPDGTVGWVISQYATKHTAKTSAVPGAPRATAPVSSSPGMVGASRAPAAVRVHSAPSLGASVVTVLPAGGAYRVLGWSNGWVHVQLANGTTGWISGTVLAPGASRPASASSTKRSYSAPSAPARASSAAGAVITAGVRIHSAPGVKAPVIGTAAAGTHVKVLGYSGSWVLVRLPTGLTGYVLGTYVR